MAKHEYQVKWQRVGGGPKRKLYTQRPAAETFAARLVRDAGDYGDLDFVYVEVREVSDWSRL